MRILLVGSYAPRQQRSMAHYVSVLASGLSAAGIDVDIWVPPVILGATRDGSLARWRQYLDTLIVAPVLLRRAARGADIVHICDHVNSPLAAAVWPKPAIVTCHDLIGHRSAQGEFPGHSVRWPGRMYQWLITRGIRRAPYLICESEWTRHQLASLEPRAMVRLVPLPVSPDIAPVTREEGRSVAERYGVPRGMPYFIQVGDNHWYKNRLGAVKIFAELRMRAAFADARLIMVGQPATEDVRSFITNAGLRDAVLAASDVSPADLSALYSGASALLFPSLEEGFGWPIIEAQACGCAVITTDKPPMTEVAGEAAVFIDSENPSRAADVIEANAERLLAMSAAAKANAARYSMSAMITPYLELCRSIVGART